jgi:ATP-dependent DNA ligase
MLAILVAEPFNAKGWAFEEKYVGYRILAYKDGSRVTLLSRNDQDYTKIFTEVAVDIGRLGPGRCCSTARPWPSTRSGLSRASKLLQNGS